MKRDRAAHICSVLAGCLLGLSLGLGVAGAGCSRSRMPEADAAVVPKTCSGSAFCFDSGAVHVCRDGIVGEVLDDCAAKGQVCNLSRCTSSVCQMAEANTNSLVGCLFYASKAENIVADQGAPTSFLVTNPGGDSAVVEIQLPSAGADGRTLWVSRPSTRVDAAGSGRLVLGDGVGLVATGVGTTVLAAVRISSDRPVTVVEIESDDVGQNATSSGGTMILPLQSLGKNYLAVTYPQVDTAAIAATPGSRGGAGRVIVIGTQMGTTIHFTPFGAVTGDLGIDGAGLGADEDYPVLLNDGDAFQINSGADHEDLTGSRVNAGLPIAVFSGNIATTYGSEATGINSPDMAYEQMPPMATWSQTYVAAALTPQSSIGCTSFFGTAGASIWRVLASPNPTTVSFEGPGASTLLVRPAGGVGTAEPLVQPLALDPGASVSLVGLGSFTVTATNPILVTQGMDCEPSLSLAIAADTGALIKNLRFAVLPNFDQLLGIVRLRGAEVDLDGGAIPEGMFQSAGSGFEVAEVPLGACAPGLGVCTHHLTASAGFGMTLRGMDVQSSYALTAPALVGCDPAYEVCVN